MNQKQIHLLMTLYSIFILIVYVLIRSIIYMYFIKYAFLSFVLSVACKLPQVVAMSSAKIWLLP